MNKLILNTVQGDKTYKFKNARIYTVSYHSKLKKNEIHTPHAAKLIFESESKIYSIIVLQPLISVDERGDIKVNTTSSLDQATLKEKYSDTKKDIKMLRSDIKLLEARYKLGITIEELIDLGLTRSKLEAILLENKKENPYKGGGF